MGRFLADFEARYGGVDCVMLWQSYTNLGVDNQNQIDQLRNMPGGIAGTWVQFDLCTGCHMSLP